MSKSLSSPTARLLQSSRLFSLPLPLPQPALETSTLGQYRGSDTATLPYPTYQAIATPSSSHFRGDWGLKRALPKKTTDSSTPHIRVKAQDNAQHITDFESAAQHTQTETKWRQMGIPIFLEKSREHRSNTPLPPKTAYDDTVDNTDPGLTSSQPRDRTRWKHDGPWIAGMEEGEFNKYLGKLSGRRTEFNAFLVQRMLEKRIREEQRLSRERGETVHVTPAKRTQMQGDVEREFEHEVQKLRHDHESSQLQSELTGYICDFFDLPAIRLRERSDLPALTRDLRSKLTDSLHNNEKGVPSTHPAAGLSHIRTNAIMENHPVYGPQALRSPVLSRVLTARNTEATTHTYAMLGVGGVAARDPRLTPGRTSPVISRSADGDARTKYRDADAMTSHLNATLLGGNKMWVQPESATIDEKGRIILDVSRAEKDSIAVKEEDVEEIYERQQSTIMGVTPLSPPGTAGNANYGKALPSIRPRPRVNGFF